MFVSDEKSQSIIYQKARRDIQRTFKIDGYTCKPSQRNIDINEQRVGNGTPPSTHSLSLEFREAIPDAEVGSVSSDLDEFWVGSQPEWEKLRAKILPKIEKFDQAFLARTKKEFVGCIPIIWHPKYDENYTFNNFPNIRNRLLDLTAEKPYKMFFYLVPQVFFGKAKILCINDCDNRI